MKFIFDFLCLYPFFIVFQRPQISHQTINILCLMPQTLVEAQIGGMGKTCNEQIIVNKWLVILTDEQDVKQILQARISKRLGC